VSGELDHLVISEYQLTKPHFERKFSRLHQTIMKGAAFGFGDERLKTLRGVLCDVIGRGDEAVAEYTEKFDSVKLTPEQFRVSTEERKKAHAEINKKLLASLRQAIANVRKYQSEIFIGDKNIHTGIKYTPIKRVGVCVPGASAPLPSTVIMTAVPAQVAGVEEIAVVSPPRYKGSIHPVILGVCHELGIEEIYRIGGVQAVAALAFGTETIGRADKIVGPGNQWVQTAKREISGFVGIDSVAGPSEVVILADENANPDWVAADMLSQAEHNPGSAILFTTSQEFAQKVLEELKKQVRDLARVKETIECLKNYSAIVVVKQTEEMISFANNLAAEHLQIQCGEKSRQIAERIVNAGAIFIGDYSPVAVGDYWAGPSHTLPTGMTARFSSALSSNDFIKSTSIIEYSKEKLAESADDIIRLAEAEGLDAHAKSVKIRQVDA
jgi:histidinol dehydrogenase